MDEFHGRSAFDPDPGLNLSSMVHEQILMCRLADMIALAVLIAETYHMARYGMEHVAHYYLQLRQQDWSAAIHHILVEAHLPLLHPPCRWKVVVMVHHPSAVQPVLARVHPFSLVLLSLVLCSAISLLPVPNASPH